jgi:hypothetical protein
MSPSAAQLQANFAKVRARIAAARAVSTGTARAVELLAVSKTQTPALIRAAAACGQRAFAENYVQEALGKLPALADLDLTWHFIGGLQRNKARAVAENFQWVHSLDRLALAEALDRSRPPHLPPLDVCLQINISGEGSKGGVAPEAALPLAEAVARLPRLRLRGLMGMASPVKEEARQRAEFRKLADTLTLLRSHLPQPAALDTLSMGMSHDLEAAIAEGATLVRIGTALFGEREKLA